MLPRVFTAAPHSLPMSRLLTSRSYKSSGRVRQSTWGSGKDKDAKLVLPKKSIHFSPFMFCLTSSYNSNIIVDCSSKSLSREKKGALSKLKEIYNFSLGLIPLTKKDLNQNCMDYKIFFWYSVIVHYVIISTAVVGEVMRKKGRY